uniref:Replication protein E1 n=1 Tax=Human papillomavirus 73 TaxID=51033 RepID=A0A0P0EQV3_HPV73|nr:early protein E1 [human papillomavirus 73]
MADSGNWEGRCTGWFNVEAIVERKTGDPIPEDENYDGGDTDESEMGDFIDNAHIPNIYAQQEIAQALYQSQQANADNEAIRVLKRKFTGSPGSNPDMKRDEFIDKQLSPQINVLSISSGRSTSKRRLFEEQASGYGNTEVETYETEVPGLGAGAGCLQNVNEEGNQSVSPRESSSGSSSISNMDIETESTPITDITNLLQSNNAKATLLAKFKEVYGLSYMELVRPYKSDKTHCQDWVCAVFGVIPSLAESLKSLLTQYCMYIHLQCLTCTWGIIVLVLVRFKCNKNRLTVHKLLSRLLNVTQERMLIEPPRLRSTPCALYWYRTSLSNISEIVGDTPEWIKRQTLVQHSLDDSQFDLSQMIQWAFDNDITDDCEIAYKYALLGNVDSNAAAFLKSNAQAKYVKDCGTMCRHYKAAERKQMSMAQWIQHRCDLTNDGGNWKDIVLFLRYQNVEFMPFLITLKQFLKGIPKQNCIVLYGPPDTGKSHFGMSLIKFIQGVVISYVNSTSHFWLSPLADAKMALLDDATPGCWTYIDKYLRNALDGNPICLDRKHKNLLQVKCPPLLITSNTNPKADDTWKYLHSRIKVFTFLNPFPFDSNGNPLYQLTNENWKAFFTKTWSKLDLTEDDDKENDGDTVQTFKCVSGRNPRTV